jgi:hypothetical protein
MASQMGLNNDDVKIDVELQVYYSSTSNPLAANCLSDKISIAGGRGGQPTGSSGPDLGLPACCVRAQSGACVSECQNNPTNSHVGSICSRADTDLILNCTTDDCGFMLCKGNFDNALKLQSDSNCTIYENYRTCLSNIRNDCLAYQLAINKAMQTVASVILNDCTTKAPSTAPATTQPPTTKRITPTPMISNPDEKYVRQCCIRQGFTGACDTACAMAYANGFDQAPNATLYPAVNKTCIPEAAFQSCLRELIFKTTAAPDTPEPFPTSAPLIQQFFNALIECSKQHGGDAQCTNSLKYPVSDGAAVYANCVMNKPGVERCFGDTLPRFFDADILNSGCCSKASPASCQTACNQEIRKVWEAVFKVTKVEGDPLESVINTFDEALTNACPNKTNLLECGEPQYNGLTLDAIDAAMRSCCDTKRPKTFTCQRTCSDLKASNSKIPNFQSCFTYQEAEYLSCIISASNTTAFGLRQLFRSQFYDQYRYTDVASCCSRASSTACRDSCPAAVASDTVPQAWYSSCRSNPLEENLLSCISDVTYGPCDGSGCFDNQQFCHGFNNKTETFRLCGTLLDGLAAAAYNEWLIDNEMTVDKSSVALKPLSSCRSDEFKALACFLMAQPCHQTNALSLICWKDCVELFTSCKSVNESLSAEDICRRIGSTSSANDCFSLSTFTSAPSKLLLRRIAVQLELTNKKYTIALEDYGSDEYQTLKTLVENEFEGLFQSAGAPGGQTVEVKGFSRSADGNVVVNFTITSRSFTQEPTLEVLLSIIQNAVQKGQVGELEISEGSLAFQVEIPGETVNAGGSGAFVLMASYKLLLTGLLVYLTSIFSK